MKKVLTFLLLFISMYTAHAAIFISGAITTNTTWTKTNSPYIVTGNLTVDSGVTLTIQPGVVVQVDTVASFFIDGRLIAEGTATDSIIFTSYSAISPFKFRWPGLSFRIKAQNDTSRISYCRIDYAIVGIHNAGTSMFISNAVIKYASSAIVLATPSMPVNCYNAITKCLITECGSGVRDFQNTSIPGLLSENTISYCNGAGYDAFNSSNGMVMTNNNFFYNHVGVWLQGSNVRGLRFNTFKGNARAALHVQANTIYTPVSNNLFMYNDSAMSLHNVMTASVANNTLAYNNVGICHNQDGVSLPNPSGMVIANNCIANNVKYNFTEKGTVDFQALNNWWGDTTVAHVDSVIYDKDDSAALGKVSYQPVLANATGCQSVSPPPPCMAPASISWWFAGPDVVISWDSVPGAKWYEYFLRFLNTPTPSSGLSTKNTSVIENNLPPGNKYLVCVRTYCWQVPFYSDWRCDTLEVPTGIGAAPQVPQPHIYPNPNNGVFTIDIPAGMQAGNATVLDVNGRIIQRKTYTAGTKLLFDMKDAAKGVYVVRFTAGTATSHATMVVN